MMEMMDTDQLWKLEYSCDEELYNKSDGKPTKSTIREVSFITNNPR